MPGRTPGSGIHVGVKSRFADGRAVYEPRVWLRGQRSYDVNGSLDKPETLIASLEAQAHPSHIEDRIAGAQRRGEEELRRIADLRRELAKPFEHDAALAQLRERRDALVSELQLRDDRDVVVQEPEAEPKRLHAPARTTDRDAAIERLDPKRSFREGRPLRHPRSRATLCGHAWCLAPPRPTSACPQIMTTPNGLNRFDALWRLARQARPYFRWLWGVAWLIAAFRPLYLAAYHAWAAGGPPSDYPEWHRAWSNVFFAAVLACWAIAGLGVWFLRPRPPSDAVRLGTGRAEFSFAVIMVIAVMGLALWAIPGAGRLVLLVPVALGVGWAFVRRRRPATSR